MLPYTKYQPSALLVDNEGRLYSASNIILHVPLRPYLHTLYTCMSTAVSISI